MSQKVYVLDTSVLLSAGKKAFHSFGDNEIVLPIIVIEELEKKRLEEGQVAPLARSLLREIERYRQLPGQDITSGVTVEPQGAKLRIEMNHIGRTILGDRYANNFSNDIRILAVALNLRQDETKKKDDGKDHREVVLVTRDLPLRIRANVEFKLNVENFVAKGDLFDGMTEGYVNSAIIDELYAKNYAKVKAPQNIVDAAGGAARYAFQLIAAENPNHKAAAIYENGHLRRWRNDIRAFNSVSGHSREQNIALDYLYNDDIDIVSLGGRAGTGKTMLSVIAGLDQSYGKQNNSNRQFGKVVVFRPLYAVGEQDLGHLPGDQNEKMNPWTEAVYDSIEGLVDSSKLEEIAARDLLRVLPTTHIRGRSLHNTFAIVDEAQNFGRSVLLTILSRLGKNSKIVFVWDATQKDNNKLGYNDGIISVVDDLKKYDSFAHIALKKSERSKTAEIAATILEDYL